MSRLKIEKNEKSVFLSVDGGEPIEFYFEDDTCKRIFLYYLNNCQAPSREPT